MLLLPACRDSHFHYAFGFSTQSLAQLVDSLVRVSRRDKENHFVIDTSTCVIATAQTTIKYRKYNTPKGPHPPAPFLAVRTDDDPLHSTAPSPQVDQEIYYKTGTGFLRLHFSNFRYSLTLFSKFFASFPHGTCALSVSHQYLVLDGIYHPL